METLEIIFGKFIFSIKDKKVRLVRFGNFAAPSESIFTEVQISGENKNSHMGVKMVNSSEGARLNYVSHEQTDKVLKIVQASELVEVKTVFTAHGGTSSVQVYTEVKNISKEEITLEEVSSLCINCLGAHEVENSKNLYFTKFTQSHHAECQPRRQSFYEFGLHKGSGELQKRLAFGNVGSWSTKEELPQGIIENVNDGKCLMFQVESNHAWYYEISDKNGEYYLYLGGANLSFGGWSKALKQGETYRTCNVALAQGRSVQEVLGEMTKYRRHIMGKCAVDESLPSIFNEYMHLSWDSPSAEQTEKIAPIVAKTGVEYYVIDCGWHDEEDAKEIYSYVGQWKESKARFPKGLRKTIDYIHSLNMKAGLWIEPEVVGIKCREMLDYYDDSCFMQRNGKKIVVMNRYFLDYRNEKVRAYMTETIRRMVEDYGANYIKFDYNQDCGVGTDYLAFCASEGLEQCAHAYLSWVDDIRELFPNVLFETCSSGGMRMDYKTLSHFSIISTSDQVDYLKYPYIVGNILSAVLPEQAAVWSYPVGVGEIGGEFNFTKDWIKENVSNDRVAMNMINSFLGRMHLASHLETLCDDAFALVVEGVAYNKSLIDAKKKSTPFFPKGFTRFGDTEVVAGFKTDEKIYLAVWCLGDATCVEIPIKASIKEVKIAYPSTSDACVSALQNSLKVQFARPKQAVFLEIEI